MIKTILFSRHCHFLLNINSIVITKHLQQNKILILDSTHRVASLLEQPRGQLCVSVTTDTVLSVEMGQHRQSEGDSHLLSCHRQRQVPGFLAARCIRRLTLWTALYRCGMKPSWMSIGSAGHYILVASSVASNLIPTNGLLWQNWYLQSILITFSSDNSICFRNILQAKIEKQLCCRLMMQPWLQRHWQATTH